MNCQALPPTAGAEAGISLDRKHCARIAVHQAATGGGWLSARALPLQLQGMIKSSCSLAPFPCLRDGACVGGSSLFTAQVMDWLSTAVLRTPRSEACHSLNGRSCRLKEQAAPAPQIRGSPLRHSFPFVQRQVEASVRNKILYLIQAWAHAFRNEPKYKVVQDTYQIMKVEGRKELVGQSGC